MPSKLEKNNLILIVHASTTEFQNMKKSNDGNP